MRRYDRDPAEKLTRRLPENPIDQAYAAGLSMRWWNAVLQRSIRYTMRQRS